MVRVLKGDLFESEAQTLVNTVNCVGVMGKGIALEFKRRFPDMFEDYAERCRQGKVRLGQPYLYHRLLPPWILNFPTKDHWRAVSRLSDIITGLEHLERHYKEWGIASLAVPALGSSNGQLEWSVVGPILHHHLSRLDIPVELYAPLDVPQEQMEMAFFNREIGLAAATRIEGGAGRIPPAWIALVEILARVVREPYHWPVGRVTFQKMAYFATTQELPTGLHYTRGSYGPFSVDVKPMITKLVNNGLLEEERAGNMFMVKPGPSFEQARQTHAEALKRWETIILSVADLLLRMQTSEAEIAATVHFTARELAEECNGQVTEGEILESVKAWKQRRRPPIAETEFAQAIRDMNLLGWIRAKPDGSLPLPPDDW